ncbi:unnamed protein product [Candidula unifasciata]|uniref:Uncharacterized protein n=1 Tax=Candidula unifasciata TaxID=100452 RepID=A0A8S3ZF90_9EUPU|nr:unnamed protein product [Candidula unifasciata]
MTNARIQTHADYINTVDFPAFQGSMSSYISRHRSVLGIYWKHLKGLQNLSTEMYCEHLKTIGISGNCSDSVQHSEGKAQATWSMLAAVSHACKFQPVDPKLFSRMPADKIPFAARHMEALLGSLRYIIYYTSQLVVIYLAVIVLKELASAVLWILIQR